MPKSVRIGNAHGFWGDRLQAAAEMLSVQPDLDYLTLDFLAEVSMSIMAAQQRRDPNRGFADDFVEIVRSLVPYWQSGGKCRLITNAGGLNPMGCARTCAEILQQAGCSGISIAVVSGDDVLPKLRQDAKSGLSDPLARNLDTLDSIELVADRLMTANAYLGAEPIATALAQGADVVITGRVADPSLTVGPCLHHFGWKLNDYDQMAGATIAGHLIECGSQVTGGISTDWLSIPVVELSAFPIVEVADDGSCVVTKPKGSGGCVSEATVKEQLLYEIGDPERYLSPDATVSFANLHVHRLADDRIQVLGAVGQAPPATYKVSATYDGGYRASGQLVIFGFDAKRKARRAADTVLAQLERSGFAFETQLVEIIGGGACDRSGSSCACDPSEVVLRISVADPSRAPVEEFTRAMMPLITAGPPGTTGYAEGRPRIHPMIGFWPCLINRDRVCWDVELLPATADSVSARHRPPAAPAASPKVVQRERHGESFHAISAAIRDTNGTLADIAWARSGDKGINANIGVIARHAGDYEWLQRELTSRRVADYFGVRVEDVMRYRLPRLAALNFVIRGILSQPLRIDSQGKALGQVLLKMPLREAQKGE